MFTGRVVEPGEPLFLTQDTDAALALAEEERDACPACGFPKVWCRDPANQFGVFEAHEEQCHVTYTREAHQSSMAEGRDAVTRVAVQTTARFRPGKEPDIYAGLGLELHGEEERPDDQ